jgi:quercetin dioxygenase-like cupin family protein
MKIVTTAMTPSRRGNSDWFTGTVWQDPIVEAADPARVRVVRVSFEPGARTAWHTHPLGQTLHVLSGVGRVQTWQGPMREILPGDTVWIAPEEKHWHGAAPNNTMIHLAIHEHLKGVHVVWLEAVTEQEYLSLPAAPARPQ